MKRGDLTSTLKYTHIYPILKLSSRDKKTIIFVTQNTLVTPLIQILFSFCFNLFSRLAFSL